MTADTPSVPAVLRWRRLRLRRWKSDGKIAHRPRRCAAAFLPTQDPHAVCHHHPPGPARPPAHRRRRPASVRHRHRPRRRRRAEGPDPARPRLLELRPLAGAGAASAPAGRRLDRRLAHGRLGLRRSRRRAPPPGAAVHQPALSGQGRRGLRQPHLPRLARRTARRPRRRSAQPSRLPAVGADRARRRRAGADRRRALARTGGARWREMAGFLLAAADNAVSRSRLARSMQRVVFHDARDDSAWLRDGFDAFDAHFVGLSGANLRDALLASGSISLVLEAVSGIAGAPPGAYWDGGLVDYHLHLPYQRDPGLVFYPHFSEHIVPGWLDKSMPWRRARDAMLDNVILVAPSSEFIATLPNGKLPDRRDFKFYGQDHAGRMRDWRRAIAESERLADACARWAEQPDLRLAGDF